MPPRGKRQKTHRAADEDEEFEDAPPPPPDDEDGGDTDEVPPPPRDDDAEAFVAPTPDDDESDDDDDDEAEARLVRRMHRAEDAKASAAGLIDKIRMEHFMCHGLLELTFNRRINFINGANGSGKSAILAALQICLGASAKATHRGNKMGDLVQEGFEGQAKVQVVLVNEGSDAHRPEVYGDRITIERTFSRRGPAKLALKDANGDKKSADKKELRCILDTLRVSVDNPVCVLDQENSKHFIRGKAKEKYKFFLKATEIDDVQQRIVRVNLAASKCLADADHQRGRLEGYAKMAINARDEYEEVMRLAKYDEDIRDLKVMLAWVSVRGAEKALEVADGKLQEAKETQAEAEARIAELEAAANERRDAAALEERMTTLNEEMNECRKATMAAQHEVGTQKKAVQKARRAQADAKAKVTSNEKEKGQLRRDLEKKRKENAKRTAEANDGARGEDVRKAAAAAARADDTLRDAAAAYEAAAKDAEAARGGLGTLGDADREAQQALRAAKDYANLEASHVKTLEDVASSPLAAFGPFQEALSKEVRKAAKTFDKPPVGPIGAHVKLTRKEHKRWTLALGKVVGKHLPSWIVASAKDRARLLEVARKLRVDTKLTVIVQKPRPRHAVRPFAAGRGLTSVLSLLNIDDDACFNALVDLAKVESTCVFAEKRQAEERGMTRDARGWRLAEGVKDLYLENGDNTGAKDGSIFIKRAGGGRRHVALGVDASAEIPEAKRAATRASDAFEGAQRAAVDARRRFEQGERADKDAQQAKALAGRARTAAERAARDAKNRHREAEEKSNEEVVLEDTSALEEELEDVEKEIRESREAVERAGDAVAAEVAKQAPLDAAFDAHQQRNDDLAKEVEGVEKEMAAAVDVQRKSAKALEKARAKRADAARAVGEHEGAVAGEVARRDAIVTKAESFTRNLLGDAWDGERPPQEEIRKHKNEEAVHHKIKFTEELKAKKLEQRGGKEVDPDVAREKMERAQLAYSEKEAGCKQIEQEGFQLRDDAKRRWARLRRIRGHICRHSNRRFDDILQQKGSSGQLTFDHEEKLLGMTFQKDNTDETTQIDNIQSLSGGERSFSTLAMLISLGATIECPFRVMDEFDVFMDQVSRKVAMKELVEMAKRMEDRQFIFITPQDLSSLPASSLIKIVKMGKPQRGQRTLDDMGFGGTQG